MKYSNIIKAVSEDLKISEDIVNKTYKAYWQGIKDIIQKLPLKENLDFDNFSRYKMNINIPSLGKLAIPWDKYIWMKNNYRKSKNAEDKESKAAI